MSFFWTSWVSIAALLVYFWTAAEAGRARGRYQVKAPAVDGPPEFLRALRVQMNTLEQLAFFLPSLWLCAFWFSDRWAALTGAVWVVSRIWYALAYFRNPAKRASGFVLSVTSAFILLLLAVAGLSGLIR
ncbi:MAPEG family protein [Undibacterium oligocarboniphilum]|uniref:MAPEG family protein n=1 Tax=Undibacterium oligocarboniphilum TaxID=666702 RepID=A0A850QGL0_9BURK|nr:MAPEG family protein [Undibacterium oligocarboniphilum]MBC3870874.1 MAPEG family protein [Undibacterium oligocarboniphilum]NVO76503.1 MAPEG family protein [Undibacterium oligocarboniphilum]